MFGLFIGIGICSIAVGALTVKLAIKYIKKDKNNDELPKKKRVTNMLQNILGIISGSVLVISGCGVLGLLAFSYIKALKVNAANYYLFMGAFYMLLFITEIVAIKYYTGKHLKISLEDND